MVERGSRVLNDAFDEAAEPSLPEPIDYVEITVSYYPKEKRKFLKIIKQSF